MTINAESRRLAKIPEAVKQRFLQLAPSPPRCAIPTSDTRRKLPEFVWPPQVRGAFVDNMRVLLCYLVGCVRSVSRAAALVCSLDDSSRVFWGVHRGTA